MLTAKGKYCLKASYASRPLSRGRACRESKLPKGTTSRKKFLDAILGDLRRASFVFSKKGPEAATCWLQPRARYESVTSFA